SEKIAVPGREALIPSLHDGELKLLPEFLPEGTHTIVLAPAAVERRAADLKETGEQFLEAVWEAAAMGADAPADGVAYVSVAAARHAQAAVERPWWTPSPLGMVDADERLHGDALRRDYDAARQPRGELETLE